MIRKIQRRSSVVICNSLILFDVAGFWGLVDLHQFGNFSEPLRLIPELLISGLAAFALYLAGVY